MIIMGKLAIFTSQKAAKTNHPKSMTRKRSYKKIILWLVLFIFLLLGGIAIYVYINLNHLLTNALHNGFDANVVSDVYELKFENLDVNILTGSVQVHNVEMLPR